MPPALAVPALPAAPEAPFVPAVAAPEAPAVATAPALPLVPPDAGGETEPEPPVIVVGAPTPLAPEGSGDEVMPDDPPAPLAAGGAEALPPAFTEPEDPHGATVQAPPAGFFEVLEHAAIEAPIATAKPNALSYRMRTSAFTGRRSARARPLRSPQDSLRSIRSDDCERPFS
jgi:hypothetical protein